MSTRETCRAERQVWQRPDQLPFLKRLSVLELGDSRAVSAAGSQLAELGARVTVLRNSRRRIHAQAVDVMWDTLKQVVKANRLLMDFSAYDIVLCDLTGLDFLAGAPTRPEYLDFVRRQATPVWVSLSPFGIDDVRIHWSGGDLVALASGGILGHSRSHDSVETPTVPSGNHGSISAGEVMGAAALHAWQRHCADGEPVHASVSMQDAVIAGAAILECAHEALRCGGQGGSARYTAPSGLYNCRDGDVYICAIDDHQWTGLCVATGNDAWKEEFPDHAARVAGAESIRAKVGAWTSSHTREETTAILQSAGVPTTPVNGPRDLRESSQYASRDFFRYLCVADLLVPLPSHPFLFELQQTSPVGAGSIPRSDSGRTEPLKVLDFSQVLGPPLGCAWLGAAGADVLKFEDLDRPEMYRRIGPFADGKPGIDRSAYFLATNFSKRGEAAHLSTDAGRQALVEAVQWADVIVQNRSVRYMERLGLDDATIRRLNPDALYVVSSGFGRTGPMRDYRAYGHNIHAYSGLVHNTRNSDGEATNIGTPLADPITGLYIFTLAMAWHLGRGSGAHVDLSMAEIVTRRFRSQIARVCETNPQPEDQAARRIGPANGRLIRCMGDSWMVLEESGVSDRELVDVWAASSARSRNRAMASDISDIPASELAIALQEAGIAASPVLDAADLLSDGAWKPTLFAEFDHPTIGQCRVAGLPWSFVGSERKGVTCPPLLAQYHSEEAYAESAPTRSPEADV